jgi:hypothetical protein
MNNQTATLLRNVVVSLKRHQLSVRPEFTCRFHFGTFQMIFKIEYKGPVQIIRIPRRHCQELLSQQWP